MNASPSPVSPALRFSLLAGGFGIGACIPLLVNENPYSLTAFMFLGQPLIAIAFLIYAVRVLRDLRTRKLL